MKSVKSIKSRTLLAGLILSIGLSCSMPTKTAQKGGGKLGWLAVGAAAAGAAYAGYQYLTRPEQPKRPAPQPQAARVAPRPAQPPRQDRQEQDRKAAAATVPAFYKQQADLFEQLLRQGRINEAETEAQKLNQQFLFDQMNRISFATIARALNLVSDAHGAEGSVESFIEELGNQLARAKDRATQQQRAEQERKARATAPAPRRTPARPAAKPIDQQTAQAIERMEQRARQQEQRDLEQALAASQLDAPRPAAAAAEPRRAPEPERKVRADAAAQKPQVIMLNATAKGGDCTCDVVYNGELLLKLLKQNPRITADQLNGHLEKLNDARAREARTTVWRSEVQKADPTIYMGLEATSDAMIKVIENLKLLQLNDYVIIEGRQNLQGQRPVAWLAEFNGLQEALGGKQMPNKITNLRNGDGLVCIINPGGHWYTAVIFKMNNKVTYYIADPDSDKYREMYTPAIDFLKTVIG